MVNIQRTRTVTALVLPGGQGLMISNRTVTAGGWWNDNGNISGCIGAWQAKGAASEAASYVDLSGNGNDLSENGGYASSWNSTNGWVFSNNGTLDTGITGSNSYSALVRISNAGTVSEACFGETTTTANASRINIYPNQSDPIAYFRAGGSYNQATTYTSGVLGVTPAAAYYNGSSLGSLTGAWSGTPTGTIFVGGHNINNRLTIEQWTGYMQAIAIYNTTLGADDVSTISTLMAAL